VHFVTLKKAFPYTLPVLTGYLFLGFSYGVLMNKTGFSLFWTSLISLTVFAGAMQFAAIALLVSTFNPLSTFLVSLLINIRHLFYGMSILDKYAKSGKKRSFLIFGLTDETFSINAAIILEDGVNKKLFYFYVTLLNYLYWNIASILGHQLSFLIPDTIKGFEFVLTALFFVLFLNQWEIKAHRLYLVIGFVCTLIAFLLVGRAQFLLLAMVLILIAMGIETRWRSSR
jgi:4-azaleucine resistance transporter AzlC